MTDVLNVGALALHFKRAASPKVVKRILFKAGGLTFPADDVPDPFDLQRGSAARLPDGGGRILISGLFDPAVQEQQRLAGYVHFAPFPALRCFGPDADPAGALVDVLQLQHAKFGAPET